MHPYDSALNMIVRPYSYFSNVCHVKKINKILSFFLSFYQTTVFTPNYEQSIYRLLNHGILKYIDLLISNLGENPIALSEFIIGNAKSIFSLLRQWDSMNVSHFTFWCGRASKSHSCANRTLWLSVTWLIGMQWDPLPPPCIPLLCDCVTVSNMHGFCYGMMLWQKGLYFCQLPGLSGGVAIPHL